jgi:hypothetical protein
MTDMSGGFALDYSQIEKEPTELAVSRRLASRIKENMYLSVAEILDDLSVYDIRMILTLSTTMDEHGGLHWESVRQAYTFGLMMASAEGVVTLTPDTADGYARMSWGFLAMESLSRKGLVDFDKQSASFISDTFACTIKPEFREEIENMALKFTPPTAGP